MRTFRLLGYAAVLSIGFRTAGRSGNPAEAGLRHSDLFDYKKGKVTIGDDLAELNLPDDFRFLGPLDARKVLEGLWATPRIDPFSGWSYPATSSPLPTESGPSRSGTSPRAT